MTLFIVFKAEIFVASPPLTDLRGLVEGFVYEIVTISPNFISLANIN